MKTAMSAVVAVALLAVVAAPVGAAAGDWSPQRFWQQQQDNLP